MAKYVEVIKWNWNGESGVEENTVTFFDTLEAALIEYNYDKRNLSSTDAEVFICEILR